MKKIIAGLVMAVAAVANAGMWEGIADENYVGGLKITERELLGKVVLLLVMNANEETEKAAPRMQELYKSLDNKRFCVLGSWAGDKEKAAAELPKLKTTFPVYMGAKLASDTTKRESGAAVVISQYGKVLAATTMHGGFNKDHEQILVEAITMVGAPPNIIPGITLEKYKSLKTSLKLGKNLKNVIKTLEKDVAKADKKTATAMDKAKAEEASSILSAIRDGKSDISDNITALSDVNPVEAYNLLSQYVKSFPDEAADNKEKLAELKVKAAEFKKQK